MSMSKFRGWQHAVWTAPLTFLMAGPAMSQAPVADAGALDEIIVTARKREEGLIEVPLAITAVTAEQIAREGIRDVEGIISRDPSLAFDLGIAPYDTRIVIRGLSPTRGRPNVATLIDGIDVSSESSGVAGGSLLINPRLIDIAQIEIVKGPQSALYGRSAFAGAISYTTADPDDEVSGSAQADFNNRDQLDLKASLSLPLTDTLGLRLNGYAFSDQGFYTNFATGSKVGGGDGQGGSLTVKWQPNDAYALKFRTEYSDDAFEAAPQAALPFNAFNTLPASASQCNIGSNSMGAASIGFVLDSNCPDTPGISALGLHAARELERLTGSRGVFNDMRIPTFIGGVGSADSLRVEISPDYTQSTDNGVTAPDFAGSDRQVLRLSAGQTYDVTYGQFTSLTGYTRALVATSFDIDKTNFLPVQQNLKTSNTTEQFSQELRFTSDFDGPVQFIAGVQYWTERSDQIELNNSATIGAGTICFAVDPFPPGGAAIEAPAGTLYTFAPRFGAPPMSPFTPTIGAPAGSCTSPTGGFTSTDISPFMAEVAAARLPSWVRRTVDHRSVYLDVEWEIVDSLKLIAEARYVEEENFVSAGFTDGSNGPGTVTLCGPNGPCLGGANVPSAGLPPAPGFFVPIIGPMGFAAARTTQQVAYPVLKEDYITPKVTLQWTPNRDMNVYASYSEARKPGGYSTVTIGGSGAPANGADILFESEKLKAYEIGAKWRSATGRMQLTGSVFKTDFTDKQVGSQVIVGNTLSNRVTNAGAAELLGIELAAQMRPSENWLLGAGLTYFSKYEYTDYRTTSRGAGEIGRVGNCSIGYIDSGTNSFTPLPTTGVIPNNPVTTSPYALTCQLDRTGNFIEDTPELALAANVGYRRPIGDGGTQLFADLDANWQDERFLEDDNGSYLNSYWIANFRIGIERDNWTATLYVDNLADDRTIRSAGTGPAIYASDFRLGGLNYSPAGPTSSFSTFVFAPKIPTTTFADLPRPQTVGLRVNYKF